jgi:hypothetical protein
MRLAPCRQRPDASAASIEEVTSEFFPNPGSMNDDQSGEGNTRPKTADDTPTAPFRTKQDHCSGRRPWVLA